ncbi:Dynamin- GTPase protein [Dispira simplex]|nr:Dynamin- GTPase protein [Dispira simplex]
MEDLIPVINRLQDVFNTVSQDHIDLPQIAVIGSQSSGKSSVLENLVGRDFLPRGTGIVTRRPLVLQLVNVPPRKPFRRTAASGSSDSGVEASNDDESRPSTSPPSSVGSHKNYDMTERAQFLHLPERVFYDFDEVRQEIQRETERLVGSNKAISRVPIHLKVTSPHVLNLTLVDLPGLTKIPVGDQPTDIERQIRDLVMEYIGKSNTIILAVSPANVDLANSESLKLARDVDPDGKRTLGVVTKIDLMDTGTDALEILTGRVFPLRLGFVGTINRSQQDTLAGKPIQDALKYEREFFRSHPVYRSIASRCGTSHLSKLLNQLLMNHIREKLPDIKTRVNALISQTEQELASYGSPTLSDQVNRPTLFLRLLTQFSTQFTASIDGNGMDMNTTELCGGARLYYIFNNIFGMALASINPCASLTNHDIRMAIRNSTGPRPSLFVPELAFELLVKPQIKCLEPPSQRCVQLAYEELMKVCQSCGSNELRKYPKLFAKFIEVVSDLLRERVAPTSIYVESLIGIQRAYINTNHPDFIGGSGALAELHRKAEAKKRDSFRGHHAQTGLTSKRYSYDGEDLEDPADVLSDTDSVTTTQGRQRESRLFNGPRRPGSVGSVRSHLLGGNTAPVGTAYQGDKFLHYFFGGGKSDSTFMDDDHKRPTLPVPNRIKEGDNSEGYPHAFGPTELMNGNAMTELRPTSMNGGQSLSSRLEQACDISSERDQLETELIRSLIASYFSIVRKTIQDLVPKAIMHLLVNHTRDNVQNRLVETLYKEHLIDELLQEDESLIAERNKCESMLEVYRKAFAIISEVP